MKRFFLYLLLSTAALHLCAGCNKSEFDNGQTDSDADMDTDADSDGDADGDTDSDTDSDGDADGDADGDTDADTDADSDGDGDSDTNAESSTDDERNDDSASEAVSRCQYDCLPHCASWSGTPMDGDCADGLKCCENAAVPDTEDDSAQDIDTGSETAPGSALDTETDTDTAKVVELNWTNPIVPQRADPHVFLHSDGYYYLAATVPAYDRIEIRRATTLGGLSAAAPQEVWRKHNFGEMGAHIWAPEIHFIDGAWYIYFTAGRSDDVWAIRMYALENTSANPLEGEWTERGRILSNWDSFSLDATTFAHNGERYYLWTQNLPDYPGTSILISKMSDPVTLTGPQVVISSPTNDWETRGHDVNEAPAVLVRNGRVFVTFSASATDANYCMGLLTADADADLLDVSSWTKLPQPVMVSSDANGQYGPGHNSFTTSSDGSVDILVYHARNYRDIVGDPLGNPDRATRAQVLEWNADGTPNFGVPVADGEYHVTLP